MAKFQKALDTLPRCVIVLTPCKPSFRVSVVKVWYVIVACWSCVQNVTVHVESS